MKEIGKIVNLTESRVLPASYPGYPEIERQPEGTPGSVLLKFH
jgi:hypothetical protein